MADLNLNQAAELLGLDPQRLEELAGTGDIWDQVRALMSLARTKPNGLRTSTA